MRVLFFFSASLLEHRGTPLRARNLLREMARRPGVDLQVISRDDSDRFREFADLRHTQVPTPADAPRALARVCRRFAPHLVYGQTHKALAHLATLAERDGPCLVVDLHGDLAVEKLERTDRSWIRRAGSFARMRLSERRLIPRMHGLTTVSHTLADKVAVYGRPTRVVWGGVDLDRFRPGPGRADDGFIRVAYAGNFRSYQGVPLLIRAGARLRRRGRPFRFLLIGDSDAFPAIGGLARELLGSAVELVPPVPFGEIPALLDQADILVIPRPAHRTAIYGFPSKLAEYLAMGKAVVASDVGDHAKVVRDRQNGLIVEAGSVDSLERALELLEDPGLRERLGRAGRESARQHLSWTVIGDTLMSFLGATVEWRQGARDDKGGID